MRDMVTDDGRIGFKNLILAAFVGLIAAVTVLVWGIPGLDPSMWNEVAVAAGVRPPQTIFPGFWRIVAEPVFKVCGISGGVRVLTFAGAALGGVAVALLCLIVRQLLALLIRTDRPYAAWSGRIAPFFACVAALLFGLSDPFSRIARVLSPSLLRLVCVLVIVHLALRWFVVGGRWRLFPLVALMGLLAGETPFGFVLPLAFIGRSLPEARETARTRGTAEMADVLPLPRDIGVGRLPERGGIRLAWRSGGEWLERE